MERRTFIETRDKIKGHHYKTGQLTCYAIGDDGDKKKGISKRYKVNTALQFAGTVNVDSPHYAAATISFNAANDKILDSANGLVTILTGDTIRVRGSGSHDTVYTVKTGGVAGEIVTNEDITADEAAGAYITICKRVTHSNNTVIDLNSRKKLEWARYIQTNKVGPASDGKLNWYDTTKCYALRVADANMAMVAGNILRIEGIDESSRYFAGAVLVCSGFANAVNLLPCLAVKSVSFTGGNTDIVVDPGNQTLIAEVAGGSRTIKIVCRNMFAYAAAANVAALGGYTDWRNPDDIELANLRDMEQPNAAPDATAFPGWPVSDYIWSSTTLPTNVVFYALIVTFSDGNVYYGLKGYYYFVALVRGG